MNPDATYSAVLIALDWGTSSLRAYRMGAEGRVLDTRHLPWGIMRLPAPRTDGPMPAPAAAGFELAFEQACGDWLRAQPGLPVIACGMVGSAQGWAQAPYLDIPADPRDIGARLAKVDTHRGATLHIIPGLLQRQGLANVIRGEETQVVGLIDSEAGAGGAALDDDLLVGLPGTHCKWVRVRGGRIVEFDTFMTGEVYAALRGHTILGRTMEDPAAPDDAAFQRGLDVAGSALGQGGVLSTIFSTRALGLTGQLSPQAQPDYLSGLLIGHEAAALRTLLDARGMPSRIVLCGDEDLCRRYASALPHFGLAAPTLAGLAAERGLWRLAVSAGLIRQN
ncbi:2-dehydro-3-deoxygalactonokinase [Bordetella genomosp. 9]|uniref:2-dehydro-3-deoxygalactonokinase n=1 Tax=Bordetella genomosp. 9 TaxID=1416803 RepID=A0A261RMR4_9BORD|nr:2-dehydro-3-deoxygalactonokinase [Bordetella genomosp. 9]OZI26067.1 2-dehydro-3-deoxygalactonokinase [Bordetella genomosp. 9]